MIGKTVVMSAPLKMEFITSAAELGQLPATRAEIAVLGRSNVGKSSLLNALAHRKNLAKVSSKPGRTQLLNCYSLGDGATIVDLPGFGYASTASAQTRKAWTRRMEAYLLEREELRLALLLIDGEVGPTKLDLDILVWLRAYTVPFQVVATKHDKVKPSKLHRRQIDLAERCVVDPRDVIWTSVEQHTGIDHLRTFVRTILGREEQR